jgi:ketosteroid isomerase-like protein
MNVFMVIEAADDLAILYNDGEVTIKDPDGREQEMTSRTMEVVRRQPDGTWRFVFDDPNARSRNPQ